MANPQDFPNFQSPAYRELYLLWKLCEDVYFGPDSWYNPQNLQVSSSSPDSITKIGTGTIRQYLPQEQAEPIEAYRARLIASYYLWDDIYRRILNGFAALLSDVHGTEDLVPSLVKAWENIDGEGNSISAFVQRMNVEAINQGGCFIFVDYPPMPMTEDGLPLIGNALDEIEFARRPRLLLYRAIDNPNKRFEQTPKGLRLIQISFREIVDIEDGDFGTVTEERWIVYTPGMVEVFRIGTDGQGKETLELISDLSHPILGSDGNPLTEIPIVFYSVTPTTRMTAIPPFLNLAKNNVHVFQLESDRFQNMHKTNMATLVIRDEQTRIDPNTGQSIAAPVTIGPNSVIRLYSEWSDAKFIEPSGAALGATRERINDLKEDMNAQGLAFLLGSDTEKTATEALIQSSQTQANFKGMITQLNSALAEIQRLWVQYTGEEDTGEISVNSGTLQMPMTTEQARLIMDLLIGGQLTYSTAMEQLQRGRVIDENVDIEAEEQALGFIASRPDEVLTPKE